MVPSAALLVAAGERKSAMQYLIGAGLVDQRFRVVARGGDVVIPLKEMPAELPEGVEVRQADAGIFEGRYSGDPYTVAVMETGLAEHLRKMLPRKWEMVGRSVVLKLNPVLLDYAFEIGRAYATALNAESAYVVLGRVKGKYRKPSLRLAYGKGGETVHRENGVDYVLDVASVMFSSSNHDERIRMSALDCTGETIVDMFAGIGHLSMPIAVHGSPARIIASEADTDTFMYLKKTIAANRVSSIYTAVNADNRELEVADCDRIIMGYLEGTRDYLQKALSMGRKGTVIHFHEEVRHGMEDVWRRLIVDRYCSGRVRALSMRKVKGYSALSDHMALDLEVLD